MMTENEFEEWWNGQPESKFADYNGFC